MEEKKKHQFNHHSHRHKLSMASQIMESKANKTNKNKITTAKKIPWKEKAMYFSSFPVSPDLFPFNKFDLSLEINDTAESREQMGQFLTLGFQKLDSLSRRTFNA